MEPIERTSVYLAALSYARLGLPVFPIRKNSKAPATQHGVHDATTNERLIKNQWQRVFRRNEAVAIACGGHVRLLVVDVDTKTNQNAESLLPEIPPTTIVQTPSGGKHIYFRLPPNVNAKNAVSILPGIDIRWQGGYVVAPPTQGYTFLQNALFETNDVNKTIALAPQWLIDLIQSHQNQEPQQKTNATPKTDNLVIPEGARNHTLARLAGAIRRFGVNQQCLQDILWVINQYHCNPPLSRDETDRIASSISRYPAEPVIATMDPPKKPRLDIRAYQGLAGLFIAELLGKTDAPPEAMLMTLLTAIGNVLGRKAHLYVNHATHYPNLFLCIVGPTGLGRKTTSWYATRNLLENIDYEWLTECVKNGLSTGEGVIHTVRDPQVTPAGKTIDPGAADKRKLFIETEFTRVLKQQLRQGNTLSDVLKEAWDGNRLSIVTKNNPIHATDAHISVIGHITPEQLRENLSDQDIAGGFGNRFLWCWAETTVTMPLPQKTNLAKLAFDITTNIRKIPHNTEITLTPQAEDLWNHMFLTSLNKPTPGISGLLLTRTAPQTLRIAMIYAILDGRQYIIPQDLHAALAIVEYSRQTVAYIWQDSTGDPKTDYILRTLKNRPNLTKAQIHSIFQRQYKGHEIEQILDNLIHMKILVPYKLQNNIVYTINHETLLPPSILPPWDPSCLSSIPAPIIDYYQNEN